MNVLFLPKQQENQLIQIIQKYCRNEFALIRMTDTMLNKSIIDASEEFRGIVRETILDYRRINKGKEFKQLHPSIVISPSGILENQTSFYRPETKNGDPRFWIYKLKGVVNPLELVYFTVHDSRLVAIPLVDYPEFEENIISFFGDNDDEEEIVKEFKDKISAVKRKGWVLSVSPNKLNDKDIGDTLERELGVNLNNLPLPDFKGEIEVKGKTLGSGTKDSLFSMVPDWKISPVKKANDMALYYGYSDNEYVGYNALFVTVGIKPNPQGLFLEVDEENEMIHQKCIKNGAIIDVCYWKFEDIKKKLFAKHPKTMWIVADKKVINKQIHFNYLKVQYTHGPIFSQFISLVQQGVITFDWRRRAKTDPNAQDIPKSKMDYGHGFRMDPSKRNLLFGETIDIEL
ncbi:MvaI/BcnI family restriction endonuclease [Paenibacillus alvei]